MHRRVFTISFASLVLAATACSNSDDVPGGPPPRNPEKHVATRSTACDSPRGSNPPEHTQAGCKTDLECTDGLNGRCQQSGLGYASCSYDACMSDADCGEGEICSCRAAGSVGANACVRAGCKTDEDCGGPWCSPSLEPGGCGGTSLSFAGYFCHTSEDECIDDADCKSSGAGGATCDFDPGPKLWRCSVRSCVSD